jgi:hypothetical protein
MEPHRLIRQLEVFPVGGNFLLLPIANNVVHPSAIAALMRRPISPVVAAPAIHPIAVFVSGHRKVTHVGPTIQITTGTIWCSTGHQARLQLLAKLHAWITLDVRSGCSIHKG